MSNNTTETKVNYFGKKQARELVAQLTADKNGKVDLSKVEALFASQAKESSLVYEDGVVVAKNCSYFNEVLSIEEFGTIGEDKDGHTKYAYQCKVAQALGRKAKTDAKAVIDIADHALEDGGDVDAWRESKVEAETILNHRVAVEDCDVIIWEVE